jgi:acetoin utilization deacetylase AcuC-like enzyme
VTIITDEKCTGYSRYAHPERPARITATVARLKKQNELPVEWIVPSTISDGQILRAHAPEMLARLNIAQDFDNDTPFFENISGYARASAAAALDALKIARTGENVFSLMRPPGHHATREHSMGFCYLNNIAIAALEAVAPQTAISSPSPQRGEGRGEEAKTVSNSKLLTPTLSPLGRSEGAGFKRVAVFDFDVHHGNGTEDILLDREGVAFFSVHQFPA